jgi:general secretion pathway protein M
VIERLPPPQRRAFALGLLGLVLLLAYLAFVEPVWTLIADYNHDINKLERRLQINHDKAAGKDELQKQFDQLKHNRGTQQIGYLNGKTPALAAAEMQDHVKRIIESNGGHLTSIQILQDQQRGEKPTDADQPTRVAIKVQLSGAVETVQKVFYSLESGQPRVFVDNVYLRSRMGYMMNRPGQPPQDQLDMRFDLYGYLQPSGSGT